MTVCVAALAADSQAIVCVADKALTYGDRIQWDSDSSKILKINPSGTLALISGDEEPISRVLANLIIKANDFWGKSISTSVKSCEDEYSSAVADLVEAKFLRPRLLDSVSYLKAVTGKKINHMMRSLADEIKAFDMDCDILMCGFDANVAPFILHVTHPGIATNLTNTGFHAIGGGWEKAISRVLLSEHQRDHSIERTLYDAFDAKVNAELAVGVGYESDACVILPNGAHNVPKEIMEIIERLWGKANRSPFDKYSSKIFEKGPPKNWKEKLAEFSNSIAKKSKP